MILFNDKYRLTLACTQKDFIDRLLNKTDIQDDFFTDKHKDFRGKIEYNSFVLVINKSSFNKNKYKIIGQITEQEDKIHIDIEIKGYKFLLLFVLTYSLFSLLGLIRYWFFISGQEDLKLFFVFLTLIGVINLYGVIKGLKKYKKQFIEKINNIN